MIQEEKELLLKDLSARLPYGIVGLYTWKCKESYNRELTGSLYDELQLSWSNTDDSQFLPYLRPMSSMTEEEEREVRILWHEDFVNKISLYNCYPKTTDFYNKNHLDYRGLIEMGLALEAPEWMYNKKTTNYDKKPRIL